MQYRRKCQITLFSFVRSSAFKLVCSAAGFLLAAAPTGVVHALVTSTGGPTGGDHIVGPFEDAFSIDHRGVGRALIDDGFPTPGICTASLLEDGGGRYMPSPRRTALAMATAWTLPELLSNGKLNPGSSSRQLPPQPQARFT